MRYALLVYSTTNLGDDIQSLAARRFLPKVDVHVDRDFVHDVDGTEPVKLILNGWFTHRPEHWPPPPHVDPLFVSFHLTREVLGFNVRGLRPSEHMLQGESLQYFRRHQPIGCRDNATVDLFRSFGIDAHFSGCLTLTLENKWSPVREDVTSLVDLPEPLVEFVKRQVGGATRELSHNLSGREPYEERFSRAEDLLRQYATSKLVVTSRLHCALPCLALGTPVVFVTDAPDTYRLSGLRDLTRHCATDDVLDGRFEFDWNSPPANPVDITPLRTRLVDRCFAFTTR